MRKHLIRFLLLVALLAFAGYAMSAEFWGSKNSNKYHYPTCASAQKINPSNLVKFSSPEQAVKAGYVPCKVCKPPSATKSDSSPMIIANFQGFDPDAQRGCCSWHGGVCG